MINVNVRKYLINCYFAGIDVQAEGASSNVSSHQHKQGKESDRRKVCWFFKRGRCHFGERCRLAHVVGEGATLSGEQDGMKHSRKSVRGNTYSLF